MGGIRERNCAGGTAGRAPLHYFNPLAVPQYFEMITYRLLLFLVRDTSFSI